MVEDSEFRFVATRAKELLAPTCAPPDHLPKFNLGFYGFGEDKIDDLRHVDTGVEHVDRNGDRQFVTRILELVYQCLGARLIVVDDLAEPAPILRIEFVKYFVKQNRVAMVAREDDGFPESLIVSLP